MKAILFIAALMVIGTLAESPFHSPSIQQAVSDLFGSDIPDKFHYNKHMFACEPHTEKWFGFPVTQGVGKVLARFPNTGNTPAIQFSWAGNFSKETDKGDVFDELYSLRLHLRSIRFFNRDENDGHPRGRKSKIINFNSFAWDWDGCAPTVGTGTYTFNLVGYRRNLRLTLLIVIGAGAGGVNFRVKAEQLNDASEIGDYDIRNWAEEYNTWALNFGFTCSTEDADDEFKDSDGLLVDQCEVNWDTGANINSISYSITNLLDSDSDIPAAVRGAPGFDLRIASADTVTASGFSFSNGAGLTSDKVLEPWTVAGTNTVYRIVRKYTFEDYLDTNSDWDDFGQSYALELNYMSFTAPAALPTYASPFFIQFDPSLCVSGYDCESIRDNIPEDIPDFVVEADPEAENVPVADAQPEPEPEAQPEPEETFEVPVVIDESSASVLSATMILVVAIVALFLN